MGWNHSGCLCGRQPLPPGLLHSGRASLVTSSPGLILRDSQILPQVPALKDGLELDQSAAKGDGSWLAAAAWRGAARALARTVLAALGPAPDGV